jgi:hypothetical protein
MEHDHPADKKSSAALLGTYARIACFILWFSFEGALTAGEPFAGRLLGTKSAASQHRTFRERMRSLHDRPPRRNMDPGRRCCGRSRNPAVQTPSASHAANRSQASSPSWLDLMEEASRSDWKPTNFGGEGEVQFEDGQVLLDLGQMLTGITYQGDFPKSNYEIRFEAMRTEGIDFFCGLTFPVGDTHCTFIAAGWAGAVVGLSCIDGRDASENETTKYMNFVNGRWYRFRVRVTDEQIEAWIDDQQVVDQPVRGRQLSTRPEMELSRPLGIAAWQSRAVVRRLAYRPLE